MIRILTKSPLLIVFFLILSFIIGLTCEKNIAFQNTLKQQVFPKWAIKLKDSIQLNTNYEKSVLYEYKCHSKSYYYLYIPSEKDEFSKIYSDNGQLVKWTPQHNFDDFLNNITNQRIVWAINPKTTFK